MATYPKTVTHAFQLAALTRLAGLIAPVLALLILLPLSCTQNKSYHLEPVQSVSMHWSTTTEHTIGPFLYENQTDRPLINQFVRAIESAELKDEAERDAEPTDWLMLTMGGTPSVLHMTHQDGTVTTVREAIDCDYPLAWRYGDGCRYWEHRWVIERNETLQGIHSEDLTGVWENLRGN
jgi:hypothetical protein